MYSLQDIELVQNLATTACGGIAVYPYAYQGIPGRILWAVCFYLMSMKCIVKYISSMLNFTIRVTLNHPLVVKIESRGMRSSIPTMYVKPSESMWITFMQMRSQFTNR